jgi:tRNA 2-selenouridine synthase
MAASWLKENEVECILVKGGYKSLRNEAVNSLKTAPSLRVLSGLTGSGKTQLLKKAKCSKVNLEEMAKHRGSSFGSHIAMAQPSQASFENELAIKIWRKEDTYLIEDESLSIGSVRLPNALKTKMNESPVVWVEASLEERCHSLVEEYVKAPLRQGIHSAQLKEHYLNSTSKISKKLGSEVTNKIRKSIERAFDFSEGQILPHEEWITLLLTNYYDKLYLHSFERLNRKVLFRGNRKACLEFLND